MKHSKILVALLLSIALKLVNCKTSEDNIIKGPDVPPIKVDHGFGQNLLNLFDEDLNLPAIINADTGEEKTYGRLKQETIQLAIWLRKHNVSRRDIISLVADNQMEAFTPGISVFLEGLVLSAWPAELILENARQYIGLLQPKVIFCIREVVSVLEEAAKLENQSPILVLLDDPKANNSIESIIGSITADEITSYKPVRIDNLEDTVLVLFTSGSTGVPKGVMHSYLSVMNNFLHNYPVTYPNQKGQPTLLTYSTPAWISWFMYFYSILFERGLTVLHKTFEPIATARMIERYRVNFFFISPSDMATLMKSKNFDQIKEKMSSVEEFLTGGSTVRPEIFDQFKGAMKNAVVRSSYGLTEIGGIATYMTGFKSEKNSTADAIGFPVKNIWIKIRDEKIEKALGPYESGEICIKKANIFSGYFKNSEATLKAFDNEGWFCTGDKGYYDKNGELFFIERMKNMMKYKNHQVTPAEIERVLYQHPDVLEAIVVPVPDLMDGEHPMAFVVKRPESKVTEEELVQLSASLGEFKMLWGGVKFLESLPRLPSKKVARTKLKEMAKLYEKHYNF